MGISGVKEMMRSTLKQGPKRLGHAATMLAVLAASSAARAMITIPTVTIGNAGNIADTRVMNDGTTGYGQVSYAYNIGQHEVTTGQYAAFLNAVAATDAYGLYNTQMTLDEAGCQITRSGSSGSYTYAVASDYANRPVNYVSWGDAARFSNWLANNQPTGAQTSGTTETGAYALGGATSDSALITVTRSNSATWAITSENEWYKAAFYNPATASYFTYATASDTLPSNDLINPDPGNNANYAASTTDDTLAGPYYRTEAGEFENSKSPYGTFDQNGNVWEWNESTYLGLFREMRGGAIGSFDVTLAADFRYIDMPTYEANTVGFRVTNTVVSVAGDFNDDLVVNAADIDLLFAATQGTVPPALSKFDLTGDGVVNSMPNTTGSDADCWVRIIKLTEYGDTNFDQQVDFADLVVLAQNYNATTGTWDQGDMDGADGVDFGDLVLLAQNYGYGALTIDQLNAVDPTFASDWQLAQSMVPEPTLTATIALIGVALPRCRRR
jgi:formylglycine-generating enzyme